MSYSKDQKEYLKSRIRRIMVMRGADVSIRDMLEILQASKITTSKDLIAKLRDKILTERRVRLDRKLAADVISDLEDSNNEAIRKLWDIVMSPESSNFEKVSALHEIRVTKEKTIQQLIIAGVLESKAPAENTIVNIKVEQQAKIIQVIGMNFDKKLEPVAFIDGEDMQKTTLPIQDKKQSNGDGEKSNSYTLPNGTIINTGGAIPIRD